LTAGTGSRYVMGPTTTRGHRVLNSFGPLLAILIPLIALQLVLLVAALYDLTRPERRVRGDNKIVWALIIIFVSMIGPILYFLAGRETE
jgi:TctA family transporter